ncbi:hypothetical protein [Spirosoma pollinicola]|uniref:hypothetical protein n=1 Tax=Spirosoma pollinicola TaxID=2057025 RepID=UPI001F0BAF7B|nr:hypothetical protein [Spirosoma pollinicola]
MIPLLALLATFFQLHLQRLHNEKSLKPLGQVTLSDHSNIIGVYLYNNGLGPLIIDQLIFIKGNAIHASIKNCLDLDARSYMHIAMDDLAERVVLPNSHLAIFEKNFGDQANEIDLNHVKEQLSRITLKVSCRDIYNNRIIYERNLKWFSRYTCTSASKSG